MTRDIVIYDPDTNGNGEQEMAPICVMSPTGMLVGIFWGRRCEICDAIDEIVDPNSCTYRPCEPGGVVLGCFNGEQEISVQEYNTAIESLQPENDDYLIRLEHFSDSSDEWLNTNEEWLPIVPAGYHYSAGVGLTKNDTEWN